MRFKVSGANKETGARMVLEFEAESKGAAERKAMQQGMSVNRVEDISEGHVGHASDESGTARRHGPGEFGSRPPPPVGGLTPPPFDLRRLPA